MLLAGICALATSLLYGRYFGSLAQFHILRPDDLFDDIAAHPTAPEYWWVYALLFSTMIPSIINLMIGMHEKELSEYKLYVAERYASKKFLSVTKREIL